MISLRMMENSRFGPVLEMIGAAGTLLLAGCGSDSTAPSSPGATSTYDAVADFSSTINTTSSTWSYRYQNGFTRNGNYLLLPGYGPDVVEQWTPMDPNAWRAQGYLPAIGVNRTGSDDSIPGTGLTWPKGAMLVHPNYDAFIILSWRSPSEAVVMIAFSFTSLHATCGNGIDWFVEQNDDGSTLAFGSINSGGSSGSRSLTGIRVRADERINFIVGPKGDFNCDSTQLTATITTSAL